MANKENVKSGTRPAAGAFRSLGDVLSPMPVEDFLRAFRDKKRLHIKASDPSRAEPLLPWQELETMISMRRFDELQVMQNGMAIPPQLYQPEPHMSAFHDVLAQGASILLPHVHVDVPQIQWLATAIERQIGVTVVVNAYCSFSRGGAFKPHWDTHDVLVIQVHGAKTWRLWDALITNPVENVGQAGLAIPEAHAAEIELSAGDVLYLPRGEPHAASVSAGASVHLTVGLFGHTGLNVVERLHQAAAEDDFLRTDLPPHAAKAQLSAYEAELKERLHRLVDGLDVSAFLEDDDTNRLPIRQVSLPTAEAATDILRLTLRRQVPLPDPPYGDLQPVRIGGSSYDLSPASVDVLRRLFVSDGQSRADLVEALSGRHEPSAVIAGVRALCRLGFLMTDRAV